MTPERYQRVKEILQAAWEVDPMDRETFLNRICETDAELRSIVAGLLQSDQQAASFLAVPVRNEALAAVAGDPHRTEPYSRRSANQPAATEPDSDGPTSLDGRMIGRYRILSSLGAGGMGQVYEARDTHLECKAAVKILHPAFTRDPEQV